MKYLLYAASGSPFAFWLRPFCDKPALFPARSACRDNAGVEGSTGATANSQQSGSPAGHAPTHCDAASTTYVYLNSTCVVPFIVRSAIRPSALISGSINHPRSLILHANKRASAIPCYADHPPAQCKPSPNSAISVGFAVQPMRPSL